MGASRFYREVLDVRFETLLDSCDLLAAFFRLFASSREHLQSTPP